MPSGAKKAGHCAIREHSKRFRELAHQTGAKAVIMRTVSVRINSYRFAWS
jgi:hypothetical protein